MYSVRVFLCGLMLLLGSSRAAAETWWEVHTDDFHLVSNAYRKDTVEIAEHLVLFEAATRVLLKDFTYRPSMPVTIVVLDELSWQGLIGNPNSEGIANIVDREAYVFIRASAWVDRGSVAQHELGHVLLAANTSRRGQPPWYDEGFAELVSTIVISEGGMRIGASPVGAWRSLRSLRWQSARDFFFTERTGVHSLPRNFYPQAWVFEHFRRFSRTPEAASLTEYLRQLNEGVEPEAALTSAFPDGLRQLETAVKAYSRQKSFEVTVAPVPDELREYRAKPVEMSAQRAAEIIGRWIARESNVIDAQLKFLERARSTTPSRVLDLQILNARITRGEASPQEARKLCQPPFTSAHEAVLCADMELTKVTSPENIQLAYQFYWHGVSLDPNHLGALIGASYLSDPTVGDVSPLVSGLERAHARSPYNESITFALAVQYSGKDLTKALQYRDQTALNGASPEEITFLKKIIEEVARRAQEKKSQ